MFANPSYSQPIGSLELVNNAKQLDGHTITYRGEVIGELMARGDYAWLHVNDGVVALSIWAKKDVFKEICSFGAYHRKGDSVELTGILNRSCLEHGGDLDIHAVSISKIANGFAVPVKISKRRIIAASILTIIVLLACLLPRVFVLLGIRI